MTDRAVVLMCVVIMVYLLPTAIAFYRGRHVGRVLLLNVGMGWTGIGWFVSLIDSLT